MASDLGAIVFLVAVVIGGGLYAMVLIHSRTIELGQKALEEMRRVNGNLLTLGGLHPYHQNPEQFAPTGLTRADQEKIDAPADYEEIDFNEFMKRDRARAEEIRRETEARRRELEVMRSGQKEKVHGEV